jgi:hypothetical protein
MEKKNLALLPQEWKPSETGKFEKALQGCKIRQESHERVKECLRMCMLKVGLRAANMPTDEEKVVLINHLTSNYSNHTLNEIFLAFDMAVLGKLEVDPQHYENFSCLYFSQIMNAYRSWAKERYKELPKEKPKELPDPAEPVTDEEWIEIGRSTWNMTKNVLLIPAKLYRILKLNPTLDDQEQIKKEAKMRIDNLLYVDRDYFLNDEDKTNFYNKLLRQIAVKNYFETK